MMLMPFFSSRSYQEVIPEKKVKKSKSKAGAKSTGGKKGKGAKAAAAAAAAEAEHAMQYPGDLSTHPLYNLHGSFPTGSSATTSRNTSMEPDVQVGDGSAHFDLSTLGALPPYPGVDPAAAHNFRNSPSATFLNLSALNGDTPSPYSTNSPRLTQHLRRLPHNAPPPMSPNTLSATRSTALPSGRRSASAAAAIAAAAASTVPITGAAKGTRSKIRAKGKGKGKANQFDDDFGDGGLGLQLGASSSSSSIPQFLPSIAALPMLPPLPPPPPPAPASSTGGGNGLGTGYHDDSDECGSECDGECGRDKSDIEREENAQMQGLQGMSFLQLQQQQQQMEDEDEEESESEEEEEDDDDEDGDEEDQEGVSPGRDYEVGSLSHHLHQVDEDEAAAALAMFGGGVEGDVQV